jgi:hypothetical protein
MLSRSRTASSSAAVITADRPRFDRDALRELAGEKVFARGEAYHRDGQVVILSSEPARVLAQVAGTEDYRTEITGRGTRIDGACSCPAFEDWASASTWSRRRWPPMGSRRATRRTARSRVRDHLKQKGVDALVAMIVDLAERDPVLFRKLDRAASTVSGDDKTIEARPR